VEVLVVEGVFLPSFSPLLLGTNWRFLGGNDVFLFLKAGLARGFVVVIVVWWI